MPRAADPTPTPEGKPLRLWLARLWGHVTDVIDEAPREHDGERIVRRAEYALARARAEQLARELATMGHSVTGSHRGWLEPGVTAQRDRR